MTRLTRCGTLLALLIVFSLAIAAIGTRIPPGAFAQEAGLDLAAMALDTGELPPGYQQTRFDDEGYTPGDRIAAIQFGDAVSAGELEPLEIAWYYSSTFFTGDESSWIYVYLSEFSTETAVEAGFDFFEDEERWASPSEESLDQAGPAAGESPKELTIGSDEGSGLTLRSIDATFRVDRVLAGVSVTTTGVEPALDLVEELASTLEGRIEAVLAGESPAGVEPGLPQSTLGIFAAWPWPGNSLEGYKSAVDFLGSDGSPARFAADYLGGYARFASAGSVEEIVQHEPPYIDIEIAAFSTNEAALGVLQAASELPARHYGNPIVRTAAPEPSLSGVDAARAFHTVRPAVPGTVGSLNLTGYEVAFVLRSHFVKVTLQSDVLNTSLTLENLEASVLDLAAQQVDCRNGSVECGPARVPEPLANTGSPASPVAVVRSDEAD